MSRFIRSFILALCAFLSLMTVSAQPAMAQAAPPPADTRTDVEKVADFFRSFGSALGTGGGETAEARHKSYEQWKDYFANPGGCWGCTLFSSMATVTDEMGREGSDIFLAGAQSAVVAFMGLWVTFQLYKLASVSHANSPAQGIDEIFNRLVLMMIILGIMRLNPYSYLMNGSPFSAMNILAGIMDSAGRLLTVDGSGCSGGGGGSAFAVSGTKLMCAMHKEMGKGLGMGAFLIANGEYSVFPGGKLEILRAIGGVIIMLAFGTMLIILPFRLFDALLRIATVSVILPIVVLAYLFKPTRGVVRAAVTSVLAAGLTFLFTCISIAIAVRLLHIAVLPVLDASYTSTAEDQGIGPLTGSQFMVIVAGAVGMATMILQSGNLASEFAGFQGQMGSAGTAGAAVTGAAAGYATRGAVSAGTAVVKGAARRKAGDADK